MHDRATPSERQLHTPTARTQPQKPGSHAGDVSKTRLAVLQAAVDQSPRMLAQRQVIRTAFGHGHSTAERPAQLMRIPVLDLDTDTAEVRELISALQKIWNGDTFTKALSKVEAAELHQRLENSDISQAILSALADRGEVEHTQSLSGDEFQGDGEDSFSWDSDDDSTPVKTSSNTDDLFFSKMKIGGLALAEVDDDDEEAPVDKVDLARRIINLLRGVNGGLPVFLAGGAAVTLAGGPREIKDLDLRIDLDRDRTFRVDDELSDGLINGINRLLNEEFDDVDDLERADPDTGMTIAGHVDDVEVSITRTPALTYMAMGPDTSGVVRLGEFDLIWDKAYSLVMRRGNEHEKRLTDLIDLLSLISGRPSLVVALRGLNHQRSAAYLGQAHKANERAGRDIYSDNLLDEFASTIDIMVDGPQEVRKKLDKMGLSGLNGVLTMVMRRVDEYVSENKPVTVI